MKTWHLIEDKWDKADVCVDGALDPFNIDAKLNGGYVALGLIYGKGDFAKTLEVSTRSGQDSDCNPSSAAGILGVMLGYNRIPEVWKAGIPAIADTRFSFTQYSFNQIVASTQARALKVVEGAGRQGQRHGNRDTGPGTSSASAGAVGDRCAAIRVEFSEPAWIFKGRFDDGKIKLSRGEELKFKETGAAGAEATFTFDGTGVAIVGRCSQEGGRADVFLDGKKVGEVDAWIPKNTHDNDYWHVNGLRAGKHSVRIVVRPDADARSSGKKIQIVRAVVYGPASGGITSRNQPPDKLQVAAHVGLD